MTFDRSRIGVKRSPPRQRYAEDEDLSDDIAEDAWDDRRLTSSRAPADLSERLSKSRRSKSEGGLRSEAGLKSRSAVTKQDGIKSRLGDLGSERKRKLEVSAQPTLAKRSMLSVSSNLKQNIINTVKDNEKRTAGGAALKSETFIEKKSKTGEAINWDSKLSRPRMGMVADMTDSRVSAKNRIRSSKGSSQDVESDIIKRTVPNQKKPVRQQPAQMLRNIVMTEVVEEDVEDFNIVRTVENDFDMEEAAGEGFFEDRVVRTRDKLTELQIKTQNQKRRNIDMDDLENDDGSDLPHWDDKVLIEVANNDRARSPPPVVASSVVVRPKLEAKRTLESKKNKQMREVMDELKDIKVREKKIEYDRQRERELRLKKEEEALKKEKEEIDRRKRVEAEKKKSEAEKKKREDLEQQRRAEEARIDALRKTNEALRLEQEQKKKDLAKKEEEEERKIRDLQRQEELLKLKVKERQKEMLELEKVKELKLKEKEKEIEDKKKIEKENRIKEEIKAIEAQEKQIRDTHKMLQKKKHEKKREKREMRSKERSRKKKKRRYSSEESSSSESEESDSESESSSSDSESETSLSESEDSEYERKQKKKQSQKQSSSSSRKPVKKESSSKKPSKEHSSSSKEVVKRRDEKRPEASKSDSVDKKRPSSSVSTKDSAELRDKLKSYLNRAKSKGPR